MAEIVSNNILGGYSMEDIVSNNQCFGSGSSRIRIIWSDPDPDPYQEVLIWIRVAPKDYSGKKSMFFKIFNFFVTFRPVSEYIINIVYKL